MNKAPLLLIGLIALSIAAKSQLSMANPQVCHDSEKYLRCYNDGYFYITFQQAKLTQLRTTDYDFAYYPKNKTIGFSRDSLQIKLLANGVMIKKGKDSSMIHSVNDFPRQFSLFNIKAEVKSDWRSIVYVYVGDKRFEIEIYRGLVSTDWDWEIVMRDAARWLFVKPLWNRRKRIDMIGMNDDLLKYTLHVESYFGSGKKVSALKSTHYVDSVLESSYGNSFVPYPIAGGFKYEYNRKGRLKHGYGKAFMKLCDCEEY